MSSASDRDLTRRAGNFDRWRSMQVVKPQGHVAADQRPDAEGGASDHIDRHIQSPRESYSEEPNGSFRRGSLFKPYGRLKLTLLAICIDIATL